MKKISYTILGVAIFCLSACNETKLSQYYQAFDTLVTITTYHNNKEEQKDIKNIILNYHSLFDKYDETSDLYKVNHTNEKTLVSEELATIIAKALDMTKISTYFNPLVGTLSDAWKDSLKENKVLDNDSITTYLNDIKNSNVTVDGNYVTRTGDATLDFGGFAKGYVANQLIKYAKKQDFNDYIFDLGSSTVALGSKNKNQEFNVGLKYLDNAYLKLKNTTISTSAIFEQYTEIDGIKYSHIINPNNGSATSLYDFVVVIHEDGVVSDTLSTALMNESETTTFKNLETELGVKLLVGKDNQIVYQTEGLDVLYH